jgi:hypothetical protein|tara:strand:+ start:6367 stop:8952 length:2586 start_codon:yes stop_codon:yes gene_type:complete
LKKYLVLLISITTLLSFSQHEIKIKVELDTILNILEIDQQILLGELKNKKDSIYLLDWNNSFNSKNTHLAKSFSEEYKKKFHLAKDKERGFTKIESIKDAYDNDLIYYRLKTNQDVIVVKLDSMNPIIRIKYRLKIPSNKFTGYGYTKSKNYYLQYWHLVPAMKLDAWTFYSNRNLNDIPSSKYNITALEIKTPDNYHVTTELKETKSELPTSNGFKYSFWESKEIYDPKIYIEKERSYTLIEGSNLIFSKNKITKSYSLNKSQLEESAKKVLDFIENELKINYNNKFIFSEADYNNNKIYDLNILPKILKLYPEEFVYELQLLKILLSKVLDNSLIINPRKEYWLKDGVQIYTMIRYVEKFYPNISLAGSLSNFPGLKNLYASKLKYNDKYYLGALHMYRINNTQKLNIPKDSLLKFNERIANNYKSGLLLYNLSKKIKKLEFSKIIINTLKLNNENSALFFKNKINKQFDNNNSYLDSLLEIKNIDHLNYYSETKSLKKSLKHKPFKIKLGKDIEDPNFNHVYITPIISYKNIYDGVNLGAEIHNKSIFKKEFNYKFKPLYSTNSKQLSGSAIIFNSKNVRNKDLFLVNYGMYANISSYDQNSLAKIYSPFINFNFRKSTNLRDNKRSSLSARFLKISHKGEIITSPEYQIFNLKYTSLNPGLINHKKWFVDYQLSESFSKISFSYEFRKLYENNRELNVRVFTGYFIHNNNNQSNSYFNYSLDRPTDYLYDYNYYGRSENNGFFSQQIIMAEGGFKSKLINSNSNNFISTLNLSSTIWKNLLLYIDMGLLKTSLDDSFRFVYDTGIRLNIITDYFEIYFPIKSSDELELNSSKYNEKIRFLFTFEPDVLLGLFRRKWY